MLPPLISLFVLVLPTADPRTTTEPLRFARDVQPILSDKCYACHGPDPKARKAKLRLDDRASAILDRDGVAALRPGKPEDSEILTRILAADDSRMPPKGTGKSLNAHEIEIIRKWITQGAEYEPHWSFVPPTRPRLPKLIATDSRPIHPIDAFVRNRLEREGLSLAARANPATLLRRLSFDLTGLPPTAEELQTFLNDSSPTAYEKTVDRLLASPHFGERMAWDWLDIARYSDTDGYQADAVRFNWPWRDWVVSAFNQNMPYNRFTIEQFAGDLLPNATTEQKLATAFHRNHMTNGEGGRDPEESRIDYVIDRINTTGTAFLGLTLNCCQCHSHKYDPISQADYYRLFAFFDSIDEDGKAGKAAKPYLKYSSPFVARTIASAQTLFDNRKADEQAARKSAEATFDRWLKERRLEVARGHRGWMPLQADRMASLSGTELRQKDGIITASGPLPRHEDYLITTRPTLPRVTGFRIDALPGEHGLGRNAQGQFILTDIKVSIRSRTRQQVREVVPVSAIADYSADSKANGGYGNIADTIDDDPRNGWANFGRDAHKGMSAIYAFPTPLVLSDDEEITIELRHRSTVGYLNLARFRLSLTDQRGELLQRVVTPPLDELASVNEEIEPKLRSLLFEQYLLDHPAYARAKASLDKANRQLAEAKAAQAVDVMVLAERDRPRETFLLVRGQWDKKGDSLTADVPTFLAPWPKGEAKTRLGLAHWLTDKRHPLTARVVVNRLWHQCFGSALVPTMEDFGLQGEPPTHPELLDWLAVELMESGWNIKHILRLIVSSATYQQSSHLSETMRLRDPENRLLARQGRHRLPSWMIRDSALRASGLLNEVIGGPPVRPYQPAGVWEEPSMGRNTYDPTDGPEQYRRTLYAFWRRSISPAFLFDAAQRRVCEVRTPRTNTPLQALTLLNDTTYIEAARSTAAIAMQSASTRDARIESITLRLLSRHPSEREWPTLRREYLQAHAFYTANPDELTRWLAHGQFQADRALNRPELAALSVIANMILNLDETITRE